MGHCFGPNQTGKQHHTLERIGANDAEKLKRYVCLSSSGANELIDYVHVGQFNFHISDNDGGHDVGASDKSDNCHTGDI